MSEGLITLVATPIGNLGDLSPRAVAALSDADVIVCEDTRHTGKLLAHAKIEHKRLMAMHDHNEAAQVGKIIEILHEGQRVAVVTDAGTPAISDPGELLVTYAAAANIRIEIVPGPSAVVAALAVSGMSTRRFVFEGFLPRKGRERKERMDAIEKEARTVVLYEAPHRLVQTVDDLAEACGASRRLAVVRELTKLHEEVWRGSLVQAQKMLVEKEPRGEYVLVIDGASKPPEPTDVEIVELLRSRLEDGVTKKDVAAEVATELGVGKRRVYELANHLDD